MSPRLPWEVIERVISHSGDNVETILNLSLTCHDLRPWSLSILVADPNFKRRSQIFAFWDFLQLNSHLKPFVRSIIVHPNDFAPVPLLNDLPNLSNITFTSPLRQYLVSNSKEANSDIDWHPPTTLLHHSTLICSHRLGTHIQTLHLSDLLFATPLDFVRALSAFTSVIHLICMAVFVKADGHPTGAPLEVMKRRLVSQGQARLQTLSVDILHPGEYTSNTQKVNHGLASAGEVLLDWGWGLSMVESLTVKVRSPYTFPQPFDWSPNRLRSLVLQLDLHSSTITDVIVLLKKFLGSRATLKEVLVELHPRGWDVHDLMTTFSKSSRSGSSKPYQELEDTLLQFSQPGIRWLVDDLNTGSDVFLTHELGRHFPRLFQRGAFTVSSNHTYLSAGHDGRLWAVVTSPDSAWVASGSADGTIILWDVGNGTIARRWFIPNYEIVLSLAFSPDSQYLVSGGTGGSAVIWDLCEGLCKPTVLEGYSDHDSIESCAWSPSGDVVATTGSRDKTIRLWDAHTFQLLSVLEFEDASDPSRCLISFLMFSPTGRWLVSGCAWIYYIWDVESDNPRQPFSSPVHEGCSNAFRLTAAFDSESTRLFVAPRNDVPKILDVQTGGELFRFGTTKPALAAALSPDGKLVVTGFEDGMMKIWDAYTGVEVILLEGHTDRVLKACFSPCGRYIASGSSDVTLRLWRTRDGSCVATFSDYDYDVSEVTFTPDGKVLWSGGLYGKISVRRMCDIIPADELDL